jgi:hypothetical protein
MQPSSPVVGQLAHIDDTVLLQDVKDTKSDERRDTLSIGRALVESHTLGSTVVVRDGRDGSSRVRCEILETHDSSSGLDHCDMLSVCIETKGDGETYKRR